MKLKVPNKDYSVTELYDSVVQIMGLDPRHSMYDCTKVNISASIQNGFFKCYRKLNPDMSESDFNSEMAMLLACYGPKVDENLEDDEVEVFDGFIL